MWKRCLRWHLKHAVTRGRIGKEHHQQRDQEVGGPKVGNAWTMGGSGSEITLVWIKEKGEGEWCLTWSWRGRQGSGHAGWNSLESGLYCDRGQPQKDVKTAGHDPVWCSLMTTLVTLWRKDWSGAGAKVGKQVGSYCESPGGRWRCHELGWREVVSIINNWSGVSVYPLVSSEFGHRYSMPNSDYNVKTQILHL